MKKISIVIFLVFSISSQAFAQSACRDLFDRTSAHPTQETMSQTYRDIHELVGSIQNNRVFFDFMIKGQSTGWHSYNTLSKLMKILNSPGRDMLSQNEKLLLEKTFAEQNAKIENSIDDLLAKDPGFHLRLERALDKSYHYFSLFEQINKKMGVKVLPKVRLDITVTNAETVLQGEKLLNILNKETIADFERVSEYKSIEDFKTAVEKYDQVARKIGELLDQHLIVAMHRPIEARFWVPITGFQNQRVTESSKGTLNADRRNKAESNLLNLPKEEFVKTSVRFMPKYAEAILSPDVKDVNHVKLADQYGSDLWIIKKSVIESRATWTPMDSLGAGTMFEHGNRLDGFLPWSLRSLATAYFYKNMKATNSFDPQARLMDLAFPTRSWMYGSRYMEVQIFGDVSIKDVEAFHFRETPPDAEFMQLLESYNIKIYDARGKRPVLYVPGV